MSYVPPKPEADGTPSRPPPAAPPIEAGPAEAGEEAPTPPSQDDLRFVNELSAVGLLTELDGDELRRVLSATPAGMSGARNIDLLSTYYAAAGDTIAGRRRRVADRFFLLADDDAVTAKSIVRKLAALCPELDDVQLERIGSDDGPLVLRCGDHVAAIVDEYEETLDTDEIDLRILDAAPTVSLQAIVQAINTLLDRHGAERRFLPLLGDVSREAYVGITVSGAIDLCRAGLLELDTKAEVLEHCAVGG